MNMQLFSSVDATFSSGLGRLVNDAFPNKPNCNCAMRKIKEGPLIYLALYALRDIMIGEELRCDYGVKDLPWHNLHAEGNEMSFNGLNYSSFYMLMSKNSECLK